MTTPYLAADIKRDEGFRCVAYQDGGGVWTIGVGHTGSAVHKGLVWTYAQIMAQLAKDIASAEDDLNAHFSWWKTLNDARQDVLVNMMFNLGLERFSAFHHTIYAVEHDEFVIACADMLMTEPWHHQIGQRCDRLAAQMKSGVRVA